MLLNAQCYSRRGNVSMSDIPQDEPADPTDLQLAEAMERYLEQVSTGSQPDVEEFLSHYPDIVDELRAALPGLEFLRDARPQAPDAISDPDSERIQSRWTLGDYRIVRELGRGGMGVVYEAEQLSLGRPVALKTLPFAAMLDQRQLTRFKNEARAAATLNHPNIVPVQTVGCERGVHFFVMQLIDGQSLARVIDQLRSSASDTDIDDIASSDFSNSSIASIDFAHQGAHDQDVSTNAAPIDAAPATQAETRSEPQAAQSTNRSGRTGVSIRVWLDWAYRRPRHWNTRTSAACCTATSSQPT